MFLGLLVQEKRGVSSGLGFSSTILEKEDFKGRKGDEVFSPTVLAKEDIKGMKGDEGPSGCSRLCSIGFSSIGLSKPGEDFLSEETLVLSSSSTPSVSPSPLLRRFSPTSDTLISHPNPLRESQMGCSGVIFNSVIGIPTLEGVESFEKASNQLLKENYDIWKFSSNPEVHDDSKKVVTQDLDSPVPKGFQVEGLTTPEKAKVQLVLEGLGIRIIQEVDSQDKVYVRRKRLTESGQPRKD